MKFVCAAIAGLVALCGCASTPSTETLIGWTTDQVEKTYGEADRRWDGHYGLPSQDYVKQHPKVVSCFHDLPNQDLYVTYELKNSRHTVIACSFVPKGSVF